MALIPGTANDLHGVLDGYRKFLREKDLATAREKRTCTGRDGSSRIDATRATRPQMGGPQIVPFSTQLVTGNAVARIAGGDTSILPSVNSKCHFAVAVMVDEMVVRRATAEHWADTASRTNPIGNNTPMAVAKLAAGYVLVGSYPSPAYA